MTRIETPAWARPHDVELDDVQPSTYHAIQQHRTQLLEVVQREVELYLNTPDLYDDGDEDGFPNRTKMTGEYYIKSESYQQKLGSAWVQIGIQCHCLEKLRLPGQIDQDYLGLHVWIKCSEQDWSFTVNGNTDSSSI